MVHKPIDRPEKDHYNKSGPLLSNMELQPFTQIVMDVVESVLAQSVWQQCF